MKKIVGYSLFIWSFVAWGLTFLVPWLGISAAQGVSLATGLIVSAEVAFILSIALLGKEFWVRIKQSFKKQSVDPVDLE